MLLILCDFNKNFFNVAPCNSEEDYKIYLRISSAYDGWSWIIFFYDRVIASDIPEKPPRAEPASGDLLREFQRLKHSPSASANK
jgi:hypothetical protein